MADLTTKALRRLWPNGRRFQPTGQTDAVIEALGDSLDRPRLFAKSVMDEAMPITATATIDQWLVLLGINLPTDATLGEKRKAAASSMASIGGQSLEYVGNILTASFENLYLVEQASLGSFTQYFYVRGFYPMARDFARISAILRKTAPAHLVPIWEARSVYDGDVDRCGIGTTGRAITGRGTTAWKPTDGQSGRTGVGVTGKEVTGRVPA